MKITSSGEINFALLKKFAENAVIGSKPASTPISDLICAVDAYRAESGPKVMLRLLKDFEGIQSECDSLRADAARYAHMKSAWDGDFLISYLDCNVHPKDWDKKIDSEILKAKTS